MDKEKVSKVCVLDWIPGCSTVRGFGENTWRHTIPGKGVDFMEGDYRWQGVPPDLSDLSGAPAKGNTLLNYCGVGSDLMEAAGVVVRPHP